MSTTFIRALLLELLLLGSFQAVALGQDSVTEKPSGHEAISAYHKKIRESALHRRALAASGVLNQVRGPAPDKLHGSIGELLEKSDEVLLVHIVRNTSQLSPSGDDPITTYDAYVIRSWRGHSAGETITFAVPMGMVAFDRQTRVTTRIEGFRPLRTGGRYLLFLDYARGTEREILPALRLVGDGVQGAFELRDEKVYPVYYGGTIGDVQVQPLTESSARQQPILGKNMSAGQVEAFAKARRFAQLYKGKPVPEIVNELDSLLSQPKN